MHLNINRRVLSMWAVKMMVLAVGFTMNAHAIAQDNAAVDVNQNWNTSCVADGRNAPMTCTMEQQIIVRETGQRLARLSISKTPGGTGFGSMLLQVPLGISIVDSLTMQIDDVAPVTVPIQTCDAAGCYAGQLIDDKQISALRAGSKLVLSFFDLQKQKIAAGFTLAGFTTAYSKID